MTAATEKAAKLAEEKLLAGKAENQIAIKTQQGPIMLATVLKRFGPFVVHKSLQESPPADEKYIVTHEPSSVAIGKFAKQKDAEARAALVAHPNMLALFDRFLAGDKEAGKKLKKHLEQAEVPFFTAVTWKRLNTIQIQEKLRQASGGTLWTFQDAFSKRHDRQTDEGRAVEFEAKFYPQEKTFYGIVDVSAVRVERPGADPAYRFGIDVNAGGKNVFQARETLPSFEELLRTVRELKIPSFKVPLTSEVPAALKPKPSASEAKENAEETLLGLYGALVERNGQLLAAGVATPVLKVPEFVRDVEKTGAMQRAAILKALVELERRKKLVFLPAEGPVNMMDLAFCPPGSKRGVLVWMKVLPGAK